MANSSTHRPWVRRRRGAAVALVVAALLSSSALAADLGPDPASDITWPSLSRVVACAVSFLADFGVTGLIVQFGGCTFYIDVMDVLRD
jgi:peptidoglycan/LPS O-acetylase OafA/YrhL